MESKLTKRIVVKKYRNARYHKSRKPRGGGVEKKKILIDSIQIMLVTNKESVKVAKKKFPCHQVDYILNLEKENKISYPAAVFFLYSEHLPVYNIWYSNLDQDYMFDNRWENDLKIFMKAKPYFKNNAGKMPNALREQLSKIESAYYDIFLMFEFENSKTMKRAPEYYVDDKKTYYNFFFGCLSP